LTCVSIFEDRLELREGHIRCLTLAAGIGAVEVTQFLLKVVQNMDCLHFQLLIFDAPVLIANVASVAREVSLVITRAMHWTRQTLEVLLASLVFDRLPHCLFVGFADLICVFSFAVAVY